MDDRTIEYYQKRVSDSGGIYGPSEVQEDFDWVTRWLQQNVAESDVLEIACGTGHWTKAASETARRVVGTDINTNLLQAARHTLQVRPVDLVAADGYQLPLIDNAFDCGFAAFWLSHVPRADIPSFLNAFVRHLKLRGRLLFIDTKWVEGYRKPIARRDEDGNTYQWRTLKDGSRYEILKNYFTEQELIGFLESFGKVQVWELKYVWAISVCCVRST